MAQLQGEIYALLTAVVWAFALVLFKRSGERVSPLALNLFKNVIGLALLAATLTIMWDGPGVLRQYPRQDICILVFSGIVGIALADTALFAALNLIGVGILSIVDCLYAPSIILFAWLLLSETLTWPLYVGGALVLGGIVVSSRHPPPPGRTRRQLVGGALLGALALALMGFGIVLAKPLLEYFPLIWATTIRLLAGTGALALLALASSKRREHWSVFKPSPVWWHSVPASVLGAYVSMILWVAGFKYAKASSVAILNQTSVIFALILATLILKEAFTRRKLVAVVLAMGGALIVVTLA